MYEKFKKENEERIRESHGRCRIYHEIVRMYRMRYENLPTILCAVGWALVMVLAIKTDMYNNYGGFISAVVIAAMLGIVAFAVTLYKEYCKYMMEDYEDRIKYERHLRNLYWGGYHYCEDKEIGV